MKLQQSRVLGKIYLALLGLGGLASSSYSIEVEGNGLPPALFSPAEAETREYEVPKSHLAFSSAHGIIAYQRDRTLEKFSTVLSIRGHHDISISLNGDNRATAVWYEELASNKYKVNLFFHQPPALRDQHGHVDVLLTGILTINGSQRLFVGDISSRSSCDLSARDESVEWNHKGGFFFDYNVRQGLR